jgi:p-hydroxybenzoate 3-monooxygenase
VRDGIAISINGERSRIDLKHYSGGKSLTVYGQTEITIDLIDTHIKAGGEIIFNTLNILPTKINTSKPKIIYQYENTNCQLNCAFIARCNDFHGISRIQIPIKSQHVFERIYSYSWLGVVAESPPPSHESIYATHKKGFALFSMRPPKKSRSYIQYAPDLNINE